jgi:hypothetical protein
LTGRYTTCEAGEIVNEKRILYLGPNFLFIDVFVAKFGVNKTIGGFSFRALILNKRW